MSVSDAISTYHSFRSLAGATRKKLSGNGKFCNGAQNFCQEWTTSGNVTGLFYTVGKQNKTGKWGCLASMVSYQAGNGSRESVTNSVKKESK